ncbi:conserved hypothetical protein [Histoplasma capsulatum H143]|uniref:Uncharacterized protein n=1 Tax=Ajellomyces capsulatus (strain H143) TaxID=544712 RepID=C6HJU4_AJECH|nr:conserved hypothetical protein [Histoplasma capsulatum H143]
MPGTCRLRADYSAKESMRQEKGLGKSPKDYLVFIGSKESAWTRRYGKPHPVRFPHVVNFEGINLLDNHVRLLNQYMAVAPCLLGGDSHSELNGSTLRYPDWQHATLPPFLLVTGRPPMFQSPDNPPPKTLEKPVLPDNYDSLGPEEKSQVDELHRRRVLFYLYKVFNGGLNERHLSGMRDPHVLLTQHLDNYNAELPNPVRCPISFTEFEVEMHYNQEPTWFQMNGLVEYWKSEMQGLSDDGWARTVGLKHGLLDGSDTLEEERCNVTMLPYDSNNYECDMDSPQEP